MLERNKTSLEEQTDPDYEQLFIVDDVGRGIGWANRMIATAEPDGDYVMILDDDDMLTNPHAIGLMKMATVTDPELLIFKADHGRLGILPRPTIWGKRPIKGGIGSCDFISRRDVWDKPITAFGTETCGDYFYLQSVWQDKPEVVWLNEQLAGIQRISKGAPE